MGPRKRPATMSATSGKAWLPHEIASGTAVSVTAESAIASADALVESQTPRNRPAVKRR